MPGWQQLYAQALYRLSCSRDSHRRMRTTIRQEATHIIQLARALKEPTDASHSTWFLAAEIESLALSILEATEGDTGQELPSYERG